MKEEKRQKDILALLSKKSSYTVYELSRALGVSESTIQRHLVKMEQYGMVSRTFGSVMIRGSSLNGFDNLQKGGKEENLQDKRLLAKAASSFLADNTAIFLDGSSTCLQLSSMLNELKGLVIFTSGLPLANALTSRSQHQVFLIGGRIDPLTRSSVGVEAEDVIDSYHASTSILTVSEISKEGIFDFSFEGAAIKRNMLLSSDCRVFIVDPSLNPNSKERFLIAPIKEASAIISLKPVEEELKTLLPKCRFVVAR